MFCHGGKEGRKEVSKRGASGTTTHQSPITPPPRIETCGSASMLILRELLIVKGRLAVTQNGFVRWEGWERGEGEGGHTGCSVTMSWDELWRK